MVLSFHGGPEGQERPGFSSTYQALLARGIAVFAPNVRGSSGFGKRFVNLDNGALRVDGVKDIEACVDAVVKAGDADPKRIGIMGGSYGGYMVMAGLTEYPDLFAAGANLFGVVNFETFFAHTEPWMAAISTIEYGDPETEAELLRRLSPIHKIDRVTAPTIVLHGANDTNVPVVEAEQVVDSLKKRSVPVEYVLFPDEGHGWRKTPNRIRSDRRDHEVVREVSESSAFPRDELAPQEEPCPEARVVTKAAARSSSLTQRNQIWLESRGPGPRPSCSGLATLGNPRFSVVGAGAGGWIPTVGRGFFTLATTAPSGSRAAVFTLTATAPVRLTAMRFRVGVGEAATFTAAFRVVVFLAAERAIAFFLATLPAAAALATERVRAFALTALRAVAFRVVAFRVTAFRTFTAREITSVSSAVNRSFSALINFRRRESAVVTSLIAILPSAIRK